MASDGLSWTEMWAAGGCEASDGSETSLEGVLALQDAWLQDRVPLEGSEGLWELRRRLLEALVVVDGLGCCWAALAGGEWVRMCTLIDARVVRGDFGEEPVWVPAWNELEGP